ncbi:uncharacterized protein LOC129803954 [Phlebotomus papatasi]|uniref:uncharacterized protein LOC129803954 n=1 Tax=Phlebotomus papatasi TaxID=29031 RepID=UPI0024833695|nr:uncharacterized protein LOC129803954 [Phlebotomus papatasi]
MNISEFFMIFLFFVLDLKLIFATSAKVSGRVKRVVAYPTNSATGILVAIAIPLDLPHRNVFVSYNFEANYNMPTRASDLVPGPLVRLDLIDRALGRDNGGEDFITVTEPYNKTLAKEHESERLINEDQETIQTTTESDEITTAIPKVTRSPHKRYTSDSLLTRKKVYKMLESKLQNYGHPGRPCLLRAICDEAADPINEHNGVLGDVIHIILTPSTSVREDLNPEYYKAEELGHSGDCSKYKKYCPQSLIDLISKVVQL